MFVGLGYSYCAPISLAAVEEFGDQYGRNPVGTGPYKFVEWTADDTIVLEINPEHTWSTTFYETQQAPRSTASSSWLFRKMLPGWRRWKRAKSMSSPAPMRCRSTRSIALQRRPASDCLPARDGRRLLRLFQPAIEPFNDVRVRQAIQHAVDLEAIVGLCWMDGCSGHQRAASAFAALQPDLAAVSL